MNTYTLNHRGLLFEDIPLDSLTVQLYKQGLYIFLPHELEKMKSDLAANPLHEVVDYEKVVSPLISEEEFQDYLKNESVPIENKSGDKWETFSHTSPLGDTGDYQHECGIKNKDHTFFADKPEDIENDELQEICDKLNSVPISSNGWKKQFINWFYKDEQTYFPTPDKCADWFEENVLNK
jgi:hypothetical protein